MKIVKYETSLIDTVASRMLALRPLAIVIFVSIFAASCQTQQTATEALVASQGSVNKRQIESRAIEVSDDTTLIRTIVSTLQDFGFKVHESNTSAGLVTGAKSQLSGGFLGLQTDVRVTVTASQVRNQKSTVRANFQKIIPSHDPRLLDQSRFLTSASTKIFQQPRTIIIFN